LSRKAVRNFIKDFGKSQMMSTQVARLGLRQKQLRSGWKSRLELTGGKRMDSAETTLGCSHGLAYSIMHDHLKFRKVCARWVPTELKDREKNKPNLSVPATSPTVCR
jgi:hypothetical protein